MIIERNNQQCLLRKLGAVTGAFQVHFGKNSSCDATSSGNGSNNSYSNPSGTFRLTWDINNASGTITFNVEADTLGYVSLGLGTKASMVNADW